MMIKFSHLAVPTITFDDGTFRRNVTYQLATFTVFICAIFFSHAAQALPAGGYQQSCRDSSVQGDTLRSMCKDRGGNLRPTQLQNFAQCVGDIFNDDGNLRCSRGALPPAGGYAQSCEQTFVESQSLRSKCRNRAGRMIETTLPDFRQCVGEIFNDDGNLRCSRGAKPPPGGYTQSCEQTFVNGPNLNSKCLNRAGRQITTTLLNFGQCVGDIFNADGNLRCSRGGLPPTGEYTQSCTGSYMDGATLHSSCKTITGAYIEASLINLGACRSTIGNINGVLTCVSGTGPIPSGSYTRSCLNIFVTPTSVTASCRTEKNAERSSTLMNPAACRTQIENSDGFLTCEKGDGPAPLGSYAKTCHDIVVSGTVLSASCRSDGGYRQSTINLTTCSTGQAANNQGVLVCQGGTNSDGSGAGAGNGNGNAGPPAQQSICSSANIPAGWIVVNIQSDPVRCPPSTTNNIQYLVQFTSVPVNGTLNVCSSSMTPENWVVTERFTDVARCGYTGTQRENVKTIKRLK